VKPAVVNISTTKTVTSGGLGMFREPFGQGSPFEQFFGEDFFRRFFGDMPEQKFEQRSLGSGFIISADGYLFTNNHVVEKADEIMVRLSDEHEYKAKVVGTDPTIDIALLKIEPEGTLPVAKIGDSNGLRVGDWVIAIGNPFGLSQTVTAGIVSAKGRLIGAGPYDNFIQTDASINPGNSGGPLFNLAGEVVGINTAIVAQGQGIGFAIPVNMAKDVLEDLKTKGKVVRGWLGVSIQDISEDIAKNLNLKSREGALVADVFEGDPAEKAGLRTGDVIVAIDGAKIKDTHELLQKVGRIRVGAETRVTVLRNGKEMSFTITVSERPDQEKLLARGKTSEYLGMTVQEITPEIAKHFGLKSVEGVIVTAVKKDGPAGKAGIEEQDIILQVNRTRIVNLKDYNRVMAKSAERESVLLLIKRGNAQYYVAIRK
jgi:serine protease Do